MSDGGLWRCCVAVKENEVVRLVVTEGFDGGRFMRV